MRWVNVVNKKVRLLVLLQELEMLRKFESRDLALANKLEKCKRGAYRRTIASVHRPIFGVCVVIDLCIHDR